LRELFKYGVIQKLWEAFGQSKEFKEFARSLNALERQKLEKHVSKFEPDGFKVLPY